MATGCDKFSFSIKNTNWCNLKCAHCCECSGPHIAPNIMPLSDVEKYVGEFCELQVPKWEHLVFTGGETMAPYFHNQQEYIPECLNIAVRHNMVPFVKTNGIWGADEDMRNLILRDFANSAYRNNVLMSMDISVDAFHKNTSAVVNILNNIVRSDYLAPAIRVTLVGFNDVKSRTEFVNIISALRAKGLIVEFNQNLEFIIAVPNVCAMKVFYDFGVNVSNIGRASDNSLGKYVPDGRPNAIDGHCLQIDNNDTAILNYKHRAHINGRPMNDVLKELLAKVR